MQKTSFQATDATTQSSNQEENERIFFLSHCKTRKKGKNIATDRK
jgi:hypothetical protein